jgi:uncharacterized protein DUF1570
MSVRRHAAFDLLRTLAVRSVVAAALLFGWNAATHAQSSSSRPARLELVIPDDISTVLPGDERRVIVRVAGLPPTVALVHCEVGDRYLVILPDGQLASVLTRDAIATDRPFVPLTKDELSRQLLDEFKGFRSKQTKRFVYIYNTSELFYIGTSRILETMYPAQFAYFERQGFDVREPIVPLVVIMFRSQQEYTEYTRMPEGVVAFYAGDSNRVLMYEQSRLSQVAPEVALKLAVGVVAHEGTHQILRNIGVQQRLSRWPMWLSEGMAEYFAPTQLGKDVRWKGVGRVHDLRMEELAAYVKAGGDRIKPGQTIRDTVTAQQLTSTGYASAWALTHYLAQRKQNKYFEIVREASRALPLVPISAADNERMFVKYFGDDFPALEAGMLKHLMALPFVPTSQNGR